MSYLQLAKQAAARLRTEGPATKQTKETEKVADALPFLAMPLDVFARKGRPVEVRVPWWPATLWFVPDVHNAEALCREGIARPRVWTASELLSLLRAAPLTTEALLTVMHARTDFNGEVVGVKRW
jgi:hypothetical protein